MQTCWSFISSTTCCRKQKSSAARWLGLLTRCCGEENSNPYFIDEAAQSLEAACWIPILKSHRVILAGDHCQLPPTIKSNEAAKQGLAITLFEKGIANHPEMATMLTVQYRMHEAIMKFSSAYFYKDELIAHEFLIRHELIRIRRLEFMIRPDADTLVCYQFIFIKIGRRKIS